MADRIVVFDKGRITQAGTPLDELYDRPATRFVAEFIGSPAINMFSANVDANGLSIPSGDLAYRGSVVRFHRREECRCSYPPNV